MKVTFINPITGVGCSNNIPQYDYNNPTNFNQIPNVPGIYIYGLKLKIGEVDKFVPLYVGISNNLRARIRQHYREEKTNGNSRKELFDFSKSVYSITEITYIYNEMLCYDSLAGIRGNKLDKITSLNLDSLIWFQDQYFYDKRLIANLFLSKTNSDHNNTIKIHLPQMAIAHPQHKRVINDLIKKITETKAKYDNGYYFAYATLEQEVAEYNKSESYITPNYGQHGESMAKTIEHATKKALQKIGINTTAKHEGAFSEIEIDLSNVQNDLINLGNHSFGNPYNTNLIIVP